MKGALLPSSSESRFTLGADCAIKSDPTRVEPVEDLAHALVAGQLGADLGRQPGHDVDDAGRNAGALGQDAKRQRREEA